MMQVVRAAGFGRQPFGHQHRRGIRVEQVRRCMPVR